ncbi:MAG: Type II secretory pathway, partial [Candidatus Nomurabacteria bacterium GW2011_GWA1_46_11]
MRFRYAARDGSGKMIRGTVDAVDVKSAAGVLKERKMLPISLDQDSKSMNLANFTVKWGRISVSDMANFTRQLSTMITAGLP